MTHAVDHRTVLSRVADEAEILAEKLHHYEESLIRASSDRSCDYAVYMTDPYADEAKFEREYDQRVAAFESGLAEVKAEIEQFVSEHRDELLELAAFGRPDSDPLADEFVPVVDRGVWR